MLRLDPNGLTSTAGFANTGGVYLDPPLGAGITVAPNNTNSINPSLFANDMASSLVTVSDGWRHVGQQSANSNSAPIRFLDAAARHVR